MPQITHSVITTLERIKEKSLNAFEQPNPKPELNPTESLRSEMKTAIYQHFTPSVTQQERICKKEIA